MIIIIQGVAMALLPIIQLVDRFWLDGQMTTRDSAVESILHVALSNGFHYSNMVWDALRFFSDGSNLYPFKLQEHVERLLSSAKRAGMVTIPHTQQELEAAALETAEAQKDKHLDHYMRLILWYSSELNPDPGNTPIRSLIATWPIAVNYGAQEGISMVVAEKLRPPEDTEDLLIKCPANYHTASRELTKAGQKGFNGTLMLAYNKGEKVIADTPTANLYLVSKGAVYMPEAYCFRGITERVVTEIAEDMCLPVIRRPIQLEELSDFEGMCTIGTAFGFRSVHKVVDLNGREYTFPPSDPITDRIRQAYSSLVRSKPAPSG